MFAVQIPPIFQMSAKIDTLRVFFFIFKCCIFLIFYLTHFQQSPKLYRSEMWPTKRLFIFFSTSVTVAEIYLHLLGLCPPTRTHPTPIPSFHTIHSYKSINIFVSNFISYLRCNYVFTSLGNLLAD